MIFPNDEFELILFSAAMASLATMFLIIFESIRKKKQTGVFILQHSDLRPTLFLWLYLAFGLPFIAILLLPALSYIFTLLVIIYGWSQIKKKIASGFLSLSSFYISNKTSTRKKTPLNLKKRNKDI